MYGRVMASGFRNGFKDLKALLFKRYLSHNYEFNSIVPEDRTGYFSIDRQDWKKQKQQIKTIIPLIYLTLFLMGFGIADLIYSLKNNTRESYRLYILYPKMTRAIDDVLEHQKVKPWIDISQGVWVRDFVQFRAFWNRVYQQIWEEKQIQRQRTHNIKVSKLKEQIEQIDKKYPIPKIKQKQSVF